MISVFCNSFSQNSCSLVEKWRQDPSGRCSKFRQNQSRDTVALARWHRCGSRDGSTHAQLSDRWSAQRLFRCQGFLNHRGLLKGNCIFHFPGLEMSLEKFLTFIFQSKISFSISGPFDVCCQAQPKPTLQLGAIMSSTCPASHPDKARFA